MILKMSSSDRPELAKVARTILPVCQYFASIASRTDPSANAMLFVHRIWVCEGPLCCNTIDLPMRLALADITNYNPTVTRQTSPLDLRYVLRGLALLMG